MPKPSLLIQSVRDPLFYFLLAGGLLFFFSSVFRSGAEHQIVFTKVDQIGLVRSWQTEFDRLPTESEFDTLANQWIRDELAVREAELLELDRDDPVIRRRLIQKLTYLIEERSVQEITDQDVLTHYEKDPALYTEPATFTFTHYFFSNERRETPEEDAKGALAQLSSGLDIADDPFIQHRNYNRQTYRQISEVFGSQFVVRLTEAARDWSLSAQNDVTWQGPFESSFGFHLVQIQAHTPRRSKDFEGAYEQVAIDLQARRRDTAKDMLFNDLMNRYDVVIE
ncbi:MAG: peptidylprolyl isomerase [Pseudomonadota bacterium]